MLKKLLNELKIEITKDAFGFHTQNENKTLYFNLRFGFSDAVNLTEQQFSILKAKGLTSRLGNQF